MCSSSTRCVRRSHARADPRREPKLLFVVALALSAAACSNDGIAGVREANGTPIDSAPPAANSIYVPNTVTITEIIDIVGADGRNPLTGNTRACASPRSPRSGTMARGRR